MRIAITGNICSGKTHLRNWLAALLPGFASTHVEDILMFDKANFECFSNSKYKDLLAYLPALYSRETSDALVNSINSFLTDNKDCIVEFPFLFESADRFDLKAFDLTICVLRDEELSTRYVKEQGLEDAHLDFIKRNQLSADVKAVMSDVLVVNDWTEDKELDSLELTAQRIVSTVKGEMLKRQFFKDFGEDSDKAWYSYSTQMSAKTRYYHNLNYVGSLFELYERVKNSVSSNLAFRLALWFHAFNLEGLYNYNKERDILFAMKDFLSTVKNLMPVPFSYQDLGSAAEFILSLSKHTLPPFCEDRSSLGSDNELFLDLVLANKMGRTHSRINKYFQATDNEYPMAVDPSVACSPDLYSARREKDIADLAAFLSRPSLTMTEVFKPYEAIIRYNLDYVLMRSQLPEGEVAPKWPDLEGHLTLEQGMKVSTYLGLNASLTSRFVIPDCPLS